MTIKILQMLGMARKAGIVTIGQDNVFASRGPKLFLITEDCAESVARKVRNRVARDGSICGTIEKLTREELGKSMGIHSAQIAALPLESGFAKKIAELLQLGGVA